MNDVNGKSCPDEETLSAFIDERCDDVDAKHVVSHVRACPSCRSEMTFVTKMIAECRGGAAGVSDREHDRIASLVGADMPGEREDAAAQAWNKIRDRLDGLLMRRQNWRDEQIDVIAAARASGMLAFRSVCGEESERYWRAEIELPTDPKAKILVHVFGVRDKRIDAGLFTLCGLRLVVEGGQASLTVDAFQRAVRKCVDVGFSDESGIESEGRIDLKGLF